MTHRTESIRALLRQGSYSLHDLRQLVKRPNGQRWSIAAIDNSVRSIGEAKKNDNLFTIEP
jgi:hypothetical protein